MQIIVTSSYGFGSGVSDKLLGERIETLVVDQNDVMLLIGQIMSHLAQGHDLDIQFDEDV